MCDCQRRAASVMGARQKNVSDFFRQKSGLYWRRQQLAHLSWRASPQLLGPFNLIRPEQHDGGRAQFEAAQFGAFFQDDLELNRPPLFTFNGKIHTNGNLFISSRR